MITVYGNPIPKARPRLGANGAVYTKRTTSEWEWLVAREYTLQNGPKFTSGPVGITLRFYRQDDRRADIDNLEKAILDALNGEAYLDDSQIVETHVSKAIDKKLPRVEIEVSEVTQ